MADTSNRRREPKGIPTGGRFAAERSGGSDASDLTEEPSAPTPRRLTDDDKLALCRVDGKELKNLLALREPDIDRVLAYNPNVGWDGLNDLHDRQTTDMMRRHILNGMCTNPSSAGHLDELFDRAAALKASDRRMALTCMAKNPMLDPATAARILDKCGKGRAWLDTVDALASNPNTSDETLGQIAMRHPADRLILHAVIGNPNAGDGALLAAGNRTDDRLDRMEAYQRLRRLPDGLDPERLDPDSPERRGLEHNPNLMDTRRLAEAATRPMDPRDAVAIVRAPNANAAILRTMAENQPRNPHVQMEILRSPACDDTVRLTVARCSESDPARQTAWRTMRNPAVFDRADVSDRMTLMGVCANPNMTEAAALDLRRRAGNRATIRLKDNPALPEEFRRAL